MGEIVGAGLVSHVPTIMLPEEVRLEINDGNEISLVPGLRRLRSEVLDRLEPDTIVVMDTHWEVTFEHIITSHDRRQGTFTSHELPRGMRQIPYDMPGDPEFAVAVSKEAEGRDDTWVLACDDPYLPIFYGTVNIWSYLNGGERWVSVGINQCGQTDDFLLLGELIGRAVARVDRRVVLLASGGLSHKFLPFRQLRGRESSSLDNIMSPEARAADEHVLSLMAAGDHKGVIDYVPEYRKVGPEGKFGHYLIMAGALGGSALTAKGEPFSEYEASVGTGQVHVWFERPAEGWTGQSSAA
ncbi:MAG TPA: catechol 1,2-dioxygenase [Actinomycetota bacterium]|jgi:3,4-dihydroxyphenylacetate 2,3-dioxygenase|nr:catechol 1,2-dioxygenase [Actinomycetota bacterium]